MSILFNDPPECEECGTEMSLFTDPETNQDCWVCDECGNWFEIER